MARVTSPVDTAFTRTAFASALGAFLLIGAIDAAYGPLLGMVSRRFGVSLPIAGTLISIHFSGALTGVASVLWARHRVSGRVLATAALATVAAGCLDMSLARAWQPLAAGAFVTGLGFGATDFSLNELVARTESRNRASRLNALNAAFGAGAVLGPVIVSILRGAALAAGFAGAAGIACVTAAGLRGIAGPGAGTTVRLAPHSGGRSARDTSSGRAAAALFGLAYLCYVGCEAGIAGWIAAHLTSLGYAPRFATGMTSAFWIALTVGRLVAILLGRVVRPRRIVLTAAPALVISLVLTAVPPAAPAAYIAAGLAAAPIFPVGLAWTAAAVAGDRRASTWALTGSMMGGVLGPGALAFIVTVAGIGAVPAVLAAFAAASYLFLLALRGRPDR